MNFRLPFRYIEPTFCSGLVDDPVLLVNIRPIGRKLLVDCGQIHHLAKRVLKSVDVLFITHAHMDHFMGVDTLARNVLVSPKTIRLFGPPGLAGKLESKLAGYDWNLTEDYWCSFRVHEIHPEEIRTYLLPGPKAFCRQLEKIEERSGMTIYRNGFLEVEADLGDHKIPVAMFRLTERPSFLVEEERIRALGLKPGPWLKDLKRRFYEGTLSGPIEVLRRNKEDADIFLIGDAEALYRDISGEQTRASIGYLTDVGLTSENRRKILELMDGVTLLVCECAYLSEDGEKARLSFHLCTDDLNELLWELRPTYLLPMHLSKSYLGRSERLYEQLQIPPSTRLLKLPEHRTPRPLLPGELSRIGRSGE